MPGWPSWLGRETHRVNTIIARFLRHLEVAGSNPAPGTFFNNIFCKSCFDLRSVSINLGDYISFSEILKEQWRADFRKIFLGKNQENTRFERNSYADQLD